MAMKKALLLLAAGLAASPLFGDTPPARSVSSQTFDGAGNAISSTAVGPDRGLDVNVLGTPSLPTGSATAAKQDTGNATLASVLSALGATLVVNGSAVTQPVSAASLPLPTGAATAARQDTGNASLATIVANTGSAATAARQDTGNASLSSIDSQLTGKATAGNQTTANGSLASIDGKLFANGGATASKVDGSSFTQPVSGTVTANAGSGTFAVSAASLPLPSGAATAGNQSTANASLSSIDGKLPALVSSRVPVDGSGVTQPVSAASLPLPSGAATAAKQPALGTAGTASTDVISVQGIAAMTPLKTDGSGVTQPISAASLPLPTGAATSANQTTANTSLSTISGQLPSTLGAKATTASLAVNIASDQTVPVSAASLPLPSGAATAANQSTANSSLSTISGQLPATLGAKATTASFAVNIASDQTVPISAASLPLPSGAATSANQSTIITAIQLIDNLPHANDVAFSNGAPAMGQLDDVSTGTVTENNVSTIRMTAARGLHFNPRNTAGTEIGTAAAPFRVDPTGTTAQPASGDVAHAAADSGNPVKIGGRYTTSIPSLSNNNRGDAMLDKFSNLRVNHGGTSFVAYSTAQTGTVIKSGAGRLVRVCLTTKGANTDTLQLWDNTAASGTSIADVTEGGTATTLSCMQLDLEFATGLTITTVGTTSRWTLVYE